MYLPLIKLRPEDFTTFLQETLVTARSSYRKLDVTDRESCIGGFISMCCTRGQNRDTSIMRLPSEPWEPTNDEQETIMDDLSQHFGAHKDTTDMFELLKLYAPTALGDVTDKLNHDQQNKTSAAIETPNNVNQEVK